MPIAAIVLGTIFFTSDDGADTRRQKRVDRVLNYSISAVLNHALIQSVRTDRASDKDPKLSSAAILTSSSSCTCRYDICTKTI
jgi:hypothetical protein